MSIISFDPGIRGVGIARWDGGRLTAAAYVKNTEKKGSGPRECAMMAHAVADWVNFQVDHIVAEWPQIYVSRILDRKSKEDPNDLLPLAGVDAAICAMFPSAAVTHYQPYEWKSNIDADAMIERIKDRLTMEEMERVSLPAKSLRHNLWDGVGAGLHYFGRLERKRIFARE